MDWRVDLICWNSRWGEEFEVRCLESWLWLQILVISHPRELGFGSPSSNWSTGVPFLAGFLWGSTGLMIRLWSLKTCIHHLSSTPGKFLPNVYISSFFINGLVLRLSGSSGHSFWQLRKTCSNTFNVLASSEVAYVGNGPVDWSLGR